MVDSLMTSLAGALTPILGIPSQVIASTKPVRLAPEVIAFVRLLLSFHGYSMVGRFASSLGQSPAHYCNS